VVALVLGIKNGTEGAAGRICCSDAAIALEAMGTSTMRSTGKLVDRIEGLRPPRRFLTIESDRYHLSVSEKKRQESCGRVAKNRRACCPLALAASAHAMTAIMLTREQCRDSAMIPFTIIRMGDRCIA
jgi:hypothetical protein